MPKLTGFKKADSAPSHQVIEKSLFSRRFRVFTERNLERIPQLADFHRSDILAMKTVAAVLPFRVNNYVVEELIDWSDIPNDPMYQLTFPQPGMLERADFERIYQLVKTGASKAEIDEAAWEIRARLNPHPAGQMELNVPKVDDEVVPGIQHKYAETVLFFPSQGQTCHAYCTYCFRWAQFVGDEELKFSGRESETLVEYLKAHPNVTSVLITGGDPLVMKSNVLRRYIEPLLAEELDHLQSIRIGTKAQAYWPYRFFGDSDSEDLLRLFEEVRSAGKQIAIMAHYSHPRELSPPVAREAIRRIQDGAIIRSQAPVIRRVNDSAAVWEEMWRTQIGLGVIPYYMFVERDTGARNYFEVPLVRALEVYNDAFRQLSGLGRTVRGPSMSATPGKVLVVGTATIKGEKVFVLRFIQARNPEWVGRPFFARFDAKATWMDELKPAFGERRFFFETSEQEESRESTTRIGARALAATS